VANPVSVCFSSSPVSFSDDSPAVSRSNRLWRILGLSFGIATSLGSSIGVGILRAPGLVASHLSHPAAIIGAWIGGGVFAFCGTLCVIELGTSVPKAGGWYIFTREAFGDFPGFAIGWAFWLSFASALGYACIVLGEYLAMLAPALASVSRPASIAILLGFLLFQFLGLRPVSRFQEGIGFLKGLVFLALAGACLWWAPPAVRPPGSTVPSPSLASAGLFSSIIFALQAVIKTYDGWQAPCFFTEEDRNPNRNLPRAMIIGTLAVTVIYVGMNLALLSVLSVPEIAASKLPVADAMARIFGGGTVKAITALAVLNVAGLLNTLFLATPLVLFAMARDGWFFRAASIVNGKGVPGFATVFSGVAGFIIVFGGSFERVFAVSAFLTVVCYTAGYAAVFALRRRQPGLARPFKVWGYPWIPLVALAGSVAFLVGDTIEDTASALWALGLLALCYPCYLVLRRLRPTP